MSFFTLVCDFISSKFTFLDKILFYVSGLVKDNPMRVSSYLPSLKELKAKQGCLNIENGVEKCFLWSILASLHPVQRRNNLDRVSKYQQYEHDLNMSGIQYPVDIKDINKFEHQNNIGVNVYGYEDQKIFLLHITTMTAASHHVILLYITAGKTSHCVLVKDLSRLVSRQYNNYKSKHYFCQYCLHGCTSKVVLKNHLGRCKLHGPQRIKLPEPWRQEGAWQSQVYKNRIPTAFTFRHLRRFRKRSM